MKKSNLRSLTALIAIMLVFSSVMVFAQSSRGTVTGAVTDPSGAVVPNATVTLTDKTTNISRTTETNGAGLFRFDAVNLGDYDLSVTASGFSKASTSNLSVAAGRAVNFDFQLRTGTAATEVTVEGSAIEVLQTTEQVRGGSIQSRALAELPIVGQNSLNLITILPGVVTSNLGGSLNSGIASINGARPRSNNFMIDGVENNDISVAGPAFSPTNNDAIAEVSVQTSNFSAEFGRAGGGVINQITKSGTNAFHGSFAWVYLSELFNGSTRTQGNTFRTNEAARASNPLLPFKSLKPAFKENIPAVAIGGPVIIPHLYDGHNRTFFFFGGQLDRFSNGGGNGSNFTIPTAAGVAVLQPLAATCPNVAAYLAILGTSRGLVDPLNPATNISIALPAGVASTSCGGGTRTGQVVQTANFNRTIPEVFLDNNHVVKFDHRISDKQQISFRWLYDRNTDNVGGQVGFTPSFDAASASRTLGGAFTHTYIISNRMTNELRVNYQRVALDFPLNDTTGLGFSLPEIAVSGLTNIGVSATFPQGRTSNSYQYQDTMSLVKGKHELRFGGDILRQLARQIAPFNSRGSATYNRSIISPFLTGNVESLANFIDDFAGPTSNIASKSFGSGLYRPNLFRWTLFLQDSWKLSSDFTLNAGLRYENFGQPANIFKYPAFVGSNVGDILSQAKIPADNNNFGPSVGFAWNPHVTNGLMSKIAGDGKTVVRGGYQLSYDASFNNLLSNLAAGSPNAVANLPVASASTAANPRGTPGVAAIIAGMSPSPITDLSVAQSQLGQNIRSPYTERWSLGIERALPGKFVLETSYIGSISRKQFRTVATNPQLPNATFTAAGARLFPLLGIRQPRLGDGAANYNSLQVDARRSFDKTVIGGFSLQSSFTWSRNMDTGSEAFGTNSDPQNPSVSPAQGAQFGKIDYAPSANDRRLRWVNTFVWDIAGPRQGLLSKFLGGWSLAGIVPLQSGTPYTIVNGTDRDFDGSTIGDRPDIGNINAPIDTRGRIVAASVCATGYQNPTVGTAAGVGCVTPNDVHFIEVPGFRLPTANTEGRNAQYTSGSVLVNTNIIKKVSVTESVKFEMRAEIFDLFNTQNFDTPSGNRTVSSSTVNFLNLNLLSGGSRTMRMGLKLIF
jgi:hypothetical protein